MADACGEYACVCRAHCLSGGDWNDSQSDIAAGNYLMIGLVVAVRVA